MATPTFGMYVSWKEFIVITKFAVIMYGMYIINGVHRPKPRSSGGNTSSNPQVSNGMERMIIMIWYDDTNWECYQTHQICLVKKMIKIKIDVYRFSCDWYMYILIQLCFTFHNNYCVTQRSHKMAQNPVWSAIPAWHRLIPVWLISVLQYKIEDQSYSKENTCLLKEITKH